ncbi:hypothetical protein [Paenibacillus sp. 1P03SA]|uniref:hypothetical protein n=1 Tax=Paenibacillus sp. 1P03SA TaxID=3132294 RepID=UPI0039A38243
MSSLSRVTTVRGYAIFLGLDPSDRSVLRKIQRQCERGDLNAKLDQGAWIIELPQKDEGEIIMRNWRSVDEVHYDGMTLVHAGYSGSGGKYKDKNKITLFYVNQVPKNKLSNHYGITWDFSEFYADEAAGTFVWPAPHAIFKIGHSDRDSTREYFGRAQFTPYGREVTFNGETLTIINRPVVYSSVAGELQYYAGATDDEGNVYKVFWNVFNMFEPWEIELRVDKSRYCKHCLTDWTVNANNAKCQHEWVPNV